MTIRMSGTWRGALLLAAAALFVVGVVSGVVLARGALSASDEPEVVSLPARWASAIANDPTTLARSADAVFEGTVVAVEQQRLWDPFEGELGDASSSERRPEPLPISVFRVKVESAWVGELAAGSEVLVEQPGGSLAQSDGDTITVVLEFDELLEVGETYLFWAQDSAADNGNLSTSPFMRLRVADDGSLEPLAAWSTLDGLRHYAERDSRGAGLEAQRLADTR